MKVFCVGSKRDAFWLNNHELVNNIDDADAVIFPGGSDWNPSLYNENEAHQTNFYDNIDIFQLKCLIEAYYKNKFLIGICRGAQLLGIANGGVLIQHVTNHMGDHSINIIGEKKLLTTNSIHHQMVNWYSLASSLENKNILLAWADSISSCYINGNNNETLIQNVNYESISLKSTSYREPEIFYLGLIKGFGIQGHPEFHMPIQTLDFINKYIKLLYNRFKNTVNPYNVLIDKRFTNMVKVYPELKATMDKFKATPKIITTPKPELSAATLNLPKTTLINTNTTTHETTTIRHTSDENRIWSDDSARNV